MKPLRRVSDGVPAKLSVVETAKEMAEPLIWMGLTAGVWFGAPHAATPLLLAGGSLAIAFEIASRLDDKPDQVEPGAWRAGRRATFQARWLRRVPFGGLAIATLIAAQAWWYGDAWGVCWSLALCGGFGWMIWQRAARDEPPIELRLDAHGLYSRELDWTIPWPVLQAVRPRTRHRPGKLGLRLGPNDLPGQSPADRAVGVDVEIDLARLALGVDQIRGEIFRHRPDLQVSQAADFDRDAIAVQIPGAETEADGRDEAALATVAVIEAAGNPALALMALKNAQKR